MEEQGFHINYLELKAIWLGLKSLCNNLKQKHIRIQSDNTTAIAYINAMAGIDIRLQQHGPANLAVVH